MNFFAELRRRNVYRAAVFYAAAGWLLVQVATQVLPFFDIPNWAVRIVVVAVIVGFPFAMLISWFYEWTPAGIKRESEVAAEASSTHETRKKLDRWIIAVLGLAVVLLLADRFVLHQDTSTVPDKSIAVLPLGNESGDKDQQYFSDGLSEDLISALSQVTGLKVISRNSSFQFRDTKDDSRTIGEKLGVAHLLEGSVRRAGDEIRVSAALINVADGSMLWSERYIRPYKDLFQMQDDITRAVAEALKAKLLPDAHVEAGAVAQSDHPASGNLDAYNAYLQGKFHDARFTEADLRRAIDYYNEAIRLDPRYAQAHAVLSLAWTSLAGRFLDGVDMRQGYAKARTSADTALSLAPNLAAAHLARGKLLIFADFDWVGGESEYRRAAHLAPNDGSAKASLGEILATLGHPEQAIELTRQALATDSLNAGSYHLLATYLMSLGRLDEAAQALRTAIELQPEAMGNHEQLTIIEILRGDPVAALRVARQEPPGDWQDAALARVRQIGGDPVAAEAALQILIDRQAGKAAYQIAQVHALRKDPDKVFEWLNRAWANRDPGIGLLLYDPLLLRYRHDPRFAAFCHKVGLPVPVPGPDASGAAVPADAATSAHVTERKP